MLEKVDTGMGTAISCSPQINSKDSFEDDTRQDIGLLKYLEVHSSLKQKYHQHKSHLGIVKMKR